MGGFGDGPYQFSGDGGPATAAVLNDPQGVAVDAHGDLFVADTYDNLVREVTPAGIITTVAGNGAAGYSGDGGTAITAELNGPTALALDSSGDLFIADTGNSVIREVTPGPDGLLSLGTISTIAGGGSNSDLAFNGSPTDAALSGPSGLVDSSGDLYIADTFNNIIREVTPGPNGLLSLGTISTIAGGGANADPAFSGSATDAAPSGPSGLTVDKSGNLYIADTGNNVVREVSDGNITTVPGSTGLNGPTGLAVDNLGNLYIADTGNNVVREVSEGIITTFAGDGTTDYASGSQAATSTGLNAPSGLAILGNTLYIADSGNNVVREVASGNINTVAGNVAATLGCPGADHPTAWRWTPRATSSSQVIPRSTRCRQAASSRRSPVISTTPQGWQWTPTAICSSPIGPMTWSARSCPVGWACSRTAR